jgi:hypothetical protein
MENRREWVNKYHYVHSDWRMTPIGPMDMGFTYIDFAGSALDRCRAAFGGTCSAEREAAEQSRREAEAARHIARHEKRMAEKTAPTG